MATETETATDDADEDVRAMIRRAGDAVDVGPAQVPAQVMAPSRRRAVGALLVAAVVIVATLVVVRPWTDQDTRLVTTPADEGAPPTTALPESVDPAIVDIGTVTVVDPGMRGITLPSVSLAELSAASVAFLAPAGWTGATELTSTGGGSGGGVSNFAVVDAAQADRMVMTFYSTSNVVAEPGPSSVAARDGSLWAVRSVGLPRPAVVAFSEPTDGQGAILFVGMTRDEWTRTLESTPSADPDAGISIAQPNPDSLPWLPDDLRGLVRSSNPTRQIYALGDFTVSVSVGAVPDTLNRLATAVTELVGEPAPRLQAAECESQGEVLGRSGVLVCGRNSVGSLLGVGATTAHLSAWRDGVRIDVEHLGDTAGFSGAQLQDLFDQMGQVINGIVAA